MRKTDLARGIAARAIARRPVAAGACICINDFIRSILNVYRHVSGKIASGVAVRGDGGVAGEGRVVGVPKFHS